MLTPTAMKRCRLKRYNFQIKNKMSKENKTSDNPQNGNDFIADVSESVFEKAVKHVQDSYCYTHLNTPYLLLGDVAELIKITTGKEIDWNELATHSS